jgi:glutamine synthetase adenylyltransferase
MRARLAGAGRAAGIWTVKDGPGGMQDIELLAQAGALIAGAAEHWPAAQLRRRRGAAGSRRTMPSPGEAIACSRACTNRGGF